MIWIKLVLSVLWIIAGVALFSKDTVVDKDKKKKLTLRDGLTIAWIVSFFVIAGIIVLL
jgi:hypothetical protein